MLGMLNHFVMGKKAADALVCKGKCIGMIIGLATGITVGYVSALCIAPSPSGARIRKKIADCGNTMVEKVLSCGTEPEEREGENGREPL